LNTDPDDQGREERRRQSDSCPKCGALVFHTEYPMPYGGPTLLLICPDPSCGYVRVERRAHERPDADPPAAPVAD
jgi:hypothetical protein